MEHGTFGFGQPVGGVIQFAYVVPDLPEAIGHYVSRLGIGPWFVRGPFCPPAGQYRGKVADVSITLARSWAGHAMIELIALNDKKPSVWREIVERRGYGFHHWAIGTRQFDEDVERYVRLGYVVAFSDKRQDGGRVAYLDTTADMAGMIELTEMTPDHEREYTDMYVACRDWDGSDPLR